MKILFYCTSLTRSAGGVFYAAAGLAAALAAAGQHVVAVGGADEYFEQDRKLWRGVELIGLPLRFKHYGLDARFISAIQAVKPDLFHLQGIWSAGSAYARFFSLKGMPVVTSPHGMLDEWIISRRRSVKVLHAALFERPLLRRGLVHALNQPEFDAITRFMPSLAQQTFVTPNGIHPVTGRIDFAGKSGLLYLGRLHPKKQVLELLDHWRRAGPRNVMLTIAGWGDSSYEAQVREACRNIDNATFIGAIYGQAKTNLLLKARWFILPSLSEGLPMAALEALAHGAIPILTRECNLPELFDKAVAMEIQKDFSDFKEVVARLSTSPDAEMERLSRQCARASDDYSWSRIATDMLGHYERIVR